MRNAKRNYSNDAVPTVDFPSIKTFNISAIDEPMVSLSSLGFKTEPAYYNQGIKGALNDVFLRKTPAMMLKKVAESLPYGIYLKIFDGYRPISVQQSLWDMYRDKVASDEANQSLTDSELDFKTSFFVSKPSYNIYQPSLHNTGGAVDVTLVDSNGNELNMGTKFDDFSDRAWTNHFEEYEDNKEIRDNRRLLYNAMINAGFTNLPSEWWHYDYGTKFWAYFTGNRALYKGILNYEIPNKVCG